MDWPSPGEAFGEFDMYCSSIFSSFNCELTNKPVDRNSIESIQAWTTMMHEWFHFAQYHSSTFGLLHSYNCLIQLQEFTRLCLTIQEKAQIYNETPVLFVPVNAAIILKKYRHQSFLDEFTRNWLKAEARLHCFLGQSTYKDLGEKVGQVPKIKLASFMAGSSIYAETPVTIAHILEPIATSIECTWLMQEFGTKQGLEIFNSLPRDRADDLNRMLPKIETDLGINPDNSMIIHDLSLMLPIEEISADNQSSIEKYSPPFRLLCAMELLATDQVDQVPDSESANYRQLAIDLSNKLNWPDPEGNLQRAIKFAEEIGSSYPPPFQVIFEDFVRAFHIRKLQADAFICLTNANAVLHNTGFQPIWHTPDGFVHSDSQKSEAASDWLLSSLMLSASRALVVDGIWNCPLIKNCTIKQPGCHTFPSHDNVECGCVAEEAVSRITAGLGRAGIVSILPPEVGKVDSE